MNEVSKKYNISASTIRYYEHIGLLPKIYRRKNGNRYFTDFIQNLLEMIVCLRGSGVSVDALKQYIQLTLQGDKTFNQQQEILENQLNLLKDKQRNLELSINRLNNKLKLYNPNN